MNTNPAKGVMTEDRALKQARDFLSQYYQDTANHAAPKLSHEAREKEVIDQLRFVAMTFA